MDSETWDVIVVGAGSAGCVVASRLSEDPQRRVLLIEAGADTGHEPLPDALRSPNYWDFLHSRELQSKYVWPDILARPTDARPAGLYWRGRGLGGSSAVNAMTAIRGVGQSFDLWARHGLFGWSAEEVLPSFISIECDLDFSAASYHGGKGRLPIYREPLANWGPVDLALREAALDLGYRWCEDHNSPQATGVSPYAANLRDGRRVSAADAFLEPARHRANLTVRCDRLAKCLLFDDGRAVGLELADGERLVSRQVILSAGAIHSPAILLRSGIGPAPRLKELGVAVIADLPGVGENFMDHAYVGATLELDTAIPRQSPNLRPLNCCVRYSSELAGGGVNDMLMHSEYRHGAGRSGDDVGGIDVWLVQAFSRGRLELKSPDPLRQPEIDLRLLSDERDLVRMRDGLRRLLRIYEHPAVREITRTVWAGAWDCPLGELGNADDASMDQWLLDNVADLSHAMGTCRMGAAKDPLAVVDAECRVFGIEGLRVIDASVIPEDPRANINLTVMMVAEHAIARSAV